MADIDDEVLAYAMVMGHDFKLREPMLGNAESPRYRERRLKATAIFNQGDGDRTASAAHFIARLMLDRSVSVKKEPGSAARSSWLILDGRTGFQLRFESASEKDVRSSMAKASPIELTGEPSATGAAMMKLKQVQIVEENAIIEKRRADKKWPPPAGSKADRILALAAAGEKFEYARLVNSRYGFNEYKWTKAPALIAKLKDPALVVARFELHKFDSPNGIEKHLRAGYAFAELAFCKLDDPRSEEVYRFEFVAHIEAASEPEKTSSKKSKLVG